MLNNYKSTDTIAQREALNLPGDPNPRVSTPKNTIIPKTKAPKY